MAKFKVGDRIASRSATPTGCITSVKTGTYAILWDDCLYPWAHSFDYIDREFRLEETVKRDLTQPSYYLDGREYEPFKVINDWDLSYALGCVIKYVARAGRKTDDPIPDLEKARNYLTMEIERLKNG